MATERERERTATEMASHRINATNPGVLELQNASAGGSGDIHEAAAQAQQQIQDGEDPEQAVSTALGAEAATGQAAEAADNLEATMMEAIGPVMGQAGEVAEQAGEAMSQAAETAEEQTEGILDAAGETAQRTGRRLVEAARGFAMEVSEALFGKRQDDERDKI